MADMKDYFTHISHLGRFFVLAVLFMGLLMASVNMKAEVHGSQKDGAVVTADSCVVTGSVIDEDGEPVVGVLVKEMNSLLNNCVISDWDGNYRIVLQRNDSPIVFSCLGFKNTIVSKEHADKVILICDDEKKLVIIK